MSGFKVVNGGFLTLIEDFGRFGLCDKGISNSGAMDEYAYIMANKLLQNPSHSNSLEIALGGLKLRAEENCMISITGADGEFYINSKSINIWRTHKIYKGDVIEFKSILKGQRTYLCVKGGFDIKTDLGSNSVSIKEGIGGIDGNKIKKDDFLPFLNYEHNANKILNKKFVPKYTKHLTLRVILGYQNDYFDKKEIEKFFSQNYLISTQNNRMGYKLESKPIQCKKDGIISEGISFGAIQVPKDGQAIILLKDRQTIGGYPKIGSVLPIDCFKLSQLGQGDFIKFEPIDLISAQEKMKVFYLSLK